MGYLVGIPDAASDLLRPKPVIDVQITRERRRRTKGRRIREKIEAKNPLKGYLEARMGNTE